MQGGVIGGICLLAFLLSLGRGEELASVNKSEVSKDVDDKKDVDSKKEIEKTEDTAESSDSEAADDLKPDVSLAVTETNASSGDGDERSGASAYSNAHSYGVPSSLSQTESKAISDRRSSYEQGLIAQSYSSPNFNGLGSSSAQAQAQVDQGINPPFPKPISPSNLRPYDPGSSYAQAQAQAYNEFYEPSPYQPSPNQGSNFAQAQVQADSESQQPRYPVPILPKSPPRFNQGSNILQSRPLTQAQNEVYQPIPVPDANPAPYDPYLVPYQPGNEVYQPIPIPDPNRLPFENSLVSFRGPNFPQAQDEREAYRYISKINQNEPNPRLYDTLSNLGSVFSSVNAHNKPSSAQAENEPYQPIPIPDANRSPYDAHMVPYKALFAQPFSAHNNPSSAQAENEPYQPIPIPDANPSPYDAHMVPYKAPFAQPFSAQNNPSSAQAENEPYQSIPIPDPNSSPYDTYMVPYKAPFAQLQAQVDQDAFPPASRPHDANIHYTAPALRSYNPLRSGYEKPESDRTPSKIAKIKNNSWDYPYYPYAPSAPNPQLYPSGADATAQAYAEVKSNVGGRVNLYPGISPGLSPGMSPEISPGLSPGMSPEISPGLSPGLIPGKGPGKGPGISPGMSPYLNDYPSESPFRPGNYPSADVAPIISGVGQSLPIAFEDAKSRVIYPREYVFPNKMPGGENAIQCTKENEFHHFWSEGIDCLVCICLNEYGLLTPVCASCGGCHKPPKNPPSILPRLPEPITVLPANPPAIPVPETPEPYPLVPQPETHPSVPVSEPYPPVPKPEPNPEPVKPGVPKLQESSPGTSPTPESFTWTPTTLPTLPPEATCKPLPSGQPFTNPLHPCQICVCKESYVSGKVDVQIQCKENPQCIAPTEMTVLPPLPDQPIAMPLPVCEKFPEEVLFPHPTDNCKVCKCSKSMTEIGFPQQLITCYPHPDCVPKLEPITEPSHLVPPPLPIPVEPYHLQPYPEPEPLPTPVVPLREPMPPVPLPEIVTIEPLPWPPVTTLAPVTTPGPIDVLTPRPGPLPGPSPHESCRPFPPNQTFQHPWDECQVCICTEATTTGMINVEVNCYTKPACCIEPPESLKQGLTGTSGVITSTNKSPSLYLSYTPRPLAPDPLSPPGYQSSYPFQPSYSPGFNPPYPDYRPPGSYNPNAYGYQRSYPYPSDANAYPAPPGPYQQYDPRYQGSPPGYPPMYQRSNYELPSVYPGPAQIMDYPQSQSSSQGGSNPQNTASNENILRAKSGNDGQDDLDDSQ